jgi:hypothetical protein
VLAATWLSFILFSILLLLYVYLLSRLFSLTCWFGRISQIEVGDFTYVHLLRNTIYKFLWILLEISHNHSTDDQFLEQQRQTHLLRKLVRRSEREDPVNDVDVRKFYCFKINTR